jgi:signal transduction histidine kinase
VASRAKILIVDDVPDNLVALQAVLRPHDADVLAAGSGREALELLLAFEVALAIVDVQMPGMDGLELAELMRGTERTREVPIIFVTAGLHDQKRVFRGYELGGVDFLHKPLDSQVLRGKVEVFLQLYRQRQMLADQLRELRRVEAELRAADQRKDEFLGLLSHELRNPLAPIRNSIYILGQADPDSEEARQARWILERQVTFLGRIVDDLLDITRITNGKVELKCCDLDLVEAARRSVEDHRASFVGAAIELRVEAPETPVWTHADPTRVAQAVGNLLSNALKFTPAGGCVEVLVTQETGFGVIEVRDDGIGIDASMLAHVFDRFSQGAQSLDRSRGGLGLGLALARAMIELHGGSVSVASDGPGRGARFAIRLPLAEKQPEAPASEPTPPIDQRQLKILIVEDNIDGAESLKVLLEIIGHDVRVARDGLAAIAIAEEMSPQVVLCDIGLPGIDGYETARRLRAIIPDSRLIALSGYAMPEDRRRGRDAGFHEHLSKPLAPDDLRRLLSGI